MFLTFDKEKVHLQVLCGTLESYKPTKDIKSIQKKVDELHAKLDKFKEEVFSPAAKEIKKLVDEENLKAQKKFTKE
jgi:hypothetical protein